MSHSPKIVSTLSNTSKNPHVSDFVVDKPLNIFAGTFNVNSKKAPKNVSLWLSSDQPPDLYVLGFQEIDMSASSMVSRENVDKTRPWNNTIRSSLELLYPDQKYDCICHKQLVGMLLCVFSNAKITGTIDNMQIRAVGTGLMNMMGNKGAVACSFSVNLTSVCVVNSHLAAHTENIDRRNQDFAEILRRVEFFPTGSSHQSRSILDHDYVVWVGDLNYRLISEINYDRVIKAIGSKDYEYLLEFDQLMTERTAGRTFHGFKEPRITFAPTYKMIPFSDSYVPYNPDAVRVPAWTDRIQYRAKHTHVPVKCHEYGSIIDHANLTFSDHRPVRSLLTITTKAQDVAKYTEAANKAFSEISKVQNEELPRIKLSTNFVDFGQLSLTCPITKYLTITNDGTVPVIFYFVSTPERDTPFPSWIFSSLSRGIISPGESKELTLSASVNSTQAREFNKFSAKPEAILSLHVKDAADHFIEIKASWTPSIFGSSQDLLLTDTRALYQDASIPIHLWALVDLLKNTGDGLKSPYLFKMSGIASEVALIKKAVDVPAKNVLQSLQSLPKNLSVHSIAEALIYLVNSSKPEAPCLAALISAYFSAMKDEIVRINDHFKEGDLDVAFSVFE